MGNHSYLSVIDFIKYTVASIYNNIFIILGLCGFLMKLFINRKNFINSLSQAEIIYFFLLLIWLPFSLFSMIKVGGNEGNFEVGVLLFLPQVINGYHYLFNYFKLFFNKKAYLIFHIFIFSVTFIQSIYGIDKLKEKYFEDNLIIQFLEKEYSYSNVLTDGNTFILAKKANLNIITSVGTINHFNNIKNFDFSRIKTALKNQKYDLIFLSEDLSYLEDKEINYLIFHYYTLKEIKDKAVKIPQDKTLKSNLYNTRNFLLF